MFKLNRHAILLTIALATFVPAAQADDSSGFFDPEIDDSVAFNSQADTGTQAYKSKKTDGGAVPSQSDSGKTKDQGRANLQTQYGLLAPGSGFTGDACKLFSSGGFSGGGGSGNGGYSLPDTATSCVDLDVAEK
jgi:uncharacterized membrane protein YgcG